MLYVLRPFLSWVSVVYNKKALANAFVGLSNAMNSFQAVYCGNEIGKHTLVRYEGPQSLYDQK